MKNLVCKICGGVLGHQNKSGYCSACGQKILHKQYYEKYFKSVKRIEEEKTGKIGICHMPECGKEFELVFWQHPTIHYCPACQKKKRYGEYKKYYKRATKKEKNKEKK